jgi:GTP pyrophosphokinase
MLLGAPFQTALQLVCRIHGQHLHKGSEIPYLSHLLGVVSIALENGATETEAMAALLHDSIEHCVKQKGDVPALMRELEATCGAEVLRLVVACSDCTGWPRPKWKERKQRFLKTLETADDSFLLVTLSDKVHNAQTALYDYRCYGPAIWENYKGKQEGTLWYYRTLLEAFQKRLHSLEVSPDLSSTRYQSLFHLVLELDRTVTTLEWMVKKQAEPGFHTPELMD